MKAIFNSRAYYYPLASLILGLYDYRLKHLAILEEINTTTERTLRFLEGGVNSQSVTKTTLKNSQ